MKSYCDDLLLEFDRIPSQRKVVLRQLSKYISDKINQNKTAQIVVICTHNSRRSHLGQLWLAVGQEYFNLPKIKTYSAGTEATSFNPRMVAALQRTGFFIEKEELKTDNPNYKIQWNEDTVPYTAFSKTLDHPKNPKNNFAAVMVCSEADEGCPIVPGCDFRLSLPYDDPKAFDGTNQEEEKYDEKVREIGREMLFVLHEIKTV